MKSKKEAPDKAKRPRAVKRVDSRLSVANLMNIEAENKFTPAEYERSLIVHSWLTLVSAAIESIFMEGKKMGAPNIVLVDILCDRIRHILRYNKNPQHRYFRFSEDWRKTWRQEEGKGGES